MGSSQLVAHYYGSKPRCDRHASYLRQHWWLELACILKLILEQIAWSYAVRSLEGEVLFGTEPTKTVSIYKQFYRAAGKMYGILNETSHVSPERTIEYLDFSGKHPGFSYRLDNRPQNCAYFLLLLIDMYLVTSEFIHGEYYERRLYTRLQSGKVTLKPRKKILVPIERFRKKLIRLSAKHPRVRMMRPRDQNEI
jgi:hypothetical protein